MASYQFFKDGIEKGIGEIKAKIPAAAPVVETPKKKKSLMLRQLRQSDSVDASAPLNHRIFYKVWHN